jgi:hypothetical protein
MTYNQGEIVYDETNGTLRLLDGVTQGGIALANQTWTQTQINTSIATAGFVSNSTLTTAVSLKAPIASPTFTGTVTGTFSGNVTGNVTGAVTGNASTATKLATARTINGVAFDGSAGISVSTLVNGANTISLGSTGITTFPGTINAGNIKNLVVNDLGGGTSLTAGSQIQIGNSAGAGAGVLIKNAVTNILGGETSLESGSKIQMDSGNVSLSSYTYNSISSSTGLESRLVVEVDNSYLNNVIRIGTRIINSGVESPTNTFQGVTISQYGNIATPGAITAASAVINGIDLKRYVDSKVWLALAVGL